MATSGTIGRTVIKTSKVIEHALRRCLIPPSNQNPEIISIAQDCLYLILTHSVNTTFNLWCIDKLLLGLQSNRGNYDLPRGTQDLLNASLGNPTLIPGELSVDTFNFTSSSRVTRIGVKFSSLPTSDQNIELQLPDDSWLIVGQVVVDDLYSVDDWHWFALDPSPEGKAIRLTGMSISEIRPSSGSTEIPLSPLNQDQYMALPNKELSVSSPSNYLMEKKLTSSVTLWGIPNSDSKYLIVRVNRQVQDVGKLTQSLAIPDRWFESLITVLASKLAIELPGVDPKRIELLLGLAEKITFEAREGESDRAPINFLPRIAPYTR